VLIEDARIYGLGDTIGYGGYTALAVAGEVPYLLWIDTRDLAAVVRRSSARVYPPTRPTDDGPKGRWSWSARMSSPALSSVSSGLGASCRRRSPSTR